MITNSRKTYFQKRLRQMLDEAVQGANQTDKAEDVDKLPDPSDRATKEMELNLARIMQERNNGLIRKIEQALDRIDDGTYGICEECEEDISEQRLKARPFSILCVECKTLKERFERVAEA